MDTRSKWNTNRYSPRTLSVFEITGAYFANIFYNHLYMTAKDRHNISSRSGYSLTDEYKAAVLAYKHGITKDKNSYERTVKDLLKYYRAVTKFITASMNDFIETILQQFIPEEHFVTLNDNEKFFFMNKILSTVVTATASDMVSMRYLELIIDLRHDDKSISDCKDRIVEIQCLERDNMFSKFIKQEIGATNGKKMRSKQHKELLEESEKIDINLCKQLREDCETLYQKYQELLMSKCELEAAESRAKKIAETLQLEIFKLNEENLRLKTELAERKMNEHEHKLPDKKQTFDKRAVQRTNVTPQKQGNMEKKQNNVEKKQINMEKQQSTAEKKQSNFVETKQNNFVETKQNNFVETKQNTPKEKQPEPQPKNSRRKPAQNEQTQPAQKTQQTQQIEEISDVESNHSEYSNNSENSNNFDNIETDKWDDFGEQNIPEGNVFLQDLE